MKARLDNLLVEKGVCETRSQARQLIKDGVVFVDEKPITKPGALVDLEVEIDLRKELFVGRGAYKLQAALAEFQIDLKDKVVADIGASTGGFTEIMLKAGAQKVYAIDVGKGQLAEKLLDDQRVVNLESTNARGDLPIPEVDFMAMDLSFISVRLVLPNLKKYLSGQGRILLLFKPQFECGANAVNSRGLVKSSQLWQQVQLDFEQWCRENQWKILAKTLSPILGKRGRNQELLYLLA